MTPTDQNKKKNFKLLNFKLEPALLERIKEHCKKYSLTKSHFIRSAIIEKLERPINIAEHHSQVVDLQPIEALMHQLMKKQDRILQALEFIQQHKAISPDILAEAKDQLLVSQPTTFDEASKIVSDIQLMQEAIAELITAGKVEFDSRRRKLKWL
ncbi:MAG: ribbon-helix-helix protein, CopG family [Candidatus Hodarchaeota archaeon]